MQHQSVARPARTTTPEAANALLDKLEAELERLKRARPRLEATVQKASHIVVAHLAGRPRHQIVRVRITPSGKPRFLFTSLTGNGAVYIVDPVSWSCTCPAAHRFPQPCKHSVSAYALWKVAQPDRSYGSMVRRDPDGCPVCEGGLVRRTQSFVNEQTGELVERILTLPCRACGGAA